MARFYNISAIFSFFVFCILWLTYDTQVIHAFDQKANDLLFRVDFFTPFHYLGETKVIFFVSFIVLIIIWIRLRDYKLMFFMFLTIVGGFGLYQFFKHLVERPRPEIVDQFSTFSFPSGHALHGFLYLVTVAYVFEKIVISKTTSRIIWTIAIILSLLTGLSRIAEGRHFASDVLAGWMLGYSWFILCVWWYESAYRSRPDREEI